MDCIMPNAFTEGTPKARKPHVCDECGAFKCHCDQGYPGGCGCGNAMGAMAADARCPTPDKYGACGLRDECKLGLSQEARTSATQADEREDQG